MMSSKLVNKNNNIIASLSFDEYVLINCLKFGYIKDEIYCSDMNEMDFVALSKKGFWNIFNEIKIKIQQDGGIKKPRNYSGLKLYNNQVTFFDADIVYTIRYANNLEHEEINSNKSFNNLKIDNKLSDLQSTIKNLIELPCLDFYKCYYDGVKMYYTPEAIQCHERSFTKVVEYDGQITFISANIFNKPPADMNDFSNLKFKKEFWQLNKEYINKSMDKLWYDNTSFENKYLNPRMEAFEQINQSVLEIPFGPEHVFTIRDLFFNYYKVALFNFVEEVIFKNPITSLC
jgi:hypothetical protein